MSYQLLLVTKPIFLAPCLSSGRTNSDTLCGLPRDFNEFNLVVFSIANFTIHRMSLNPSLI